MSRQMKDSGIEWIGEIPADWTTGRTKNCFSNHKNIAGEKAEEYERLALTLNGVIKRSKEDATGLQPEAFNGYQILRKGELVFKLIDLENVSTSRVGLSPYDGIVSPAYIVIEGREGCSTRFGKYFFLSMWQREVFNHMGDDGVRSSLNAGDLLNISYVYPNFSEQERIADYLDQQCAYIDAVIEKTKASIEEYKKLKQAVITQAVAKGIRGDRPMKDSGIEWIGEIPADWEVTKLKYICNTQGRIGFKGYTVQDQVDEGEGALSLGATHMVNGKISLNNPVYISWDKYYESPEIMVKKNDLLIVQRGSTIGKVAIVDKDYGEVTINPSLVLINKICINPLYLLYSLSTNYVKTCIEIIGSNTAIPMISQKQINDLVICMPKEKELNEILAYLDEKCVAIDELIEKKEKTVIELENYKKSLIYEYVTGKKEVPQSCQ